MKSKKVIFKKVNKESHDIRRIHKYERRRIELATWSDGYCIKHIFECINTIFFDNISIILLLIPSIHQRRFQWKRSKMQSSLVWDGVLLNQNRCWKGVDGVFLHTSRCQDLMAYKRFIFNPGMQHIWHAFSRLKFPVVSIILIWQRKLCPNFLPLQTLGCRDDQLINNAIIKWCVFQQCLSWFSIF